LGHHQKAGADAGAAMITELCLSFVRRLNAA
jgi:hypothetical protein